MPHAINNIHDKFIRQILSDKEMAVAFLSQYLPGPLIEVVDFETLTHQDTSYINENLKASYSDLIWSVKIRNEESLQISLLLEHKSYVDPKVIFQLLEYLAAGYRKQLHEKKKPELIIPILYYHGKKNWKFKRLQDYFTAYPDFRKIYLPVFTPEFVNLHEVPAEQILALQNGMLSSAMMLQKYCFDPVGLNIHIHNIAENLRPYLDSNITDVIFVYMIKGTALDHSYFSEAVQKLPDSMSTKVKTLYDQLIHLGKEQGLVEGKERGLAEGLEKGMEKTILNAYKAGLELATIRIITGESEEKINRILVRNECKPLRE